MAEAETKQARYTQSMKDMGYGRVSVWLGDDTRARLDRLCASLSLPKADVIALALFRMEKGKN